ncbi:MULTISPECIES: hypothetical protein [Halobacteriales]
MKTGSRVSLAGTMLQTKHCHLWCVTSVR